MNMSDMEMHKDAIFFYTDGVSVRVIWHDADGGRPLVFETKDDRVLSGIFPLDCGPEEADGTIWRKMSHTGCDWGLLRQAIAALNFNKGKDDRILPLIECSRPIWERNPYEPIPEPIPHPDIDGENA